MRREGKVPASFVKRTTCLKVMMSFGRVYYQMNNELCETRGKTMLES